MADARTPRFTCPFCDKAFQWKAPQAGRKVACPQCAGVLRVPAQAGAPGEPVQPPDPIEEDSDYELDIPSTGGSASTSASASSSASHEGKCPACNAPVKPAVVLCVNCGYHLVQGQRLETAVGAPAKDAPASPAPAGQAVSAQTFNSPLAQLSTHRGVDADALAQDMEAEHRWKEYQLPGLIIAGSLVLMLLNAGVMAPLAYSASDFYTQSSGSSWIYGLFRLIYAAVRLVVQVPAMLIGILLTARIFGSSFGTLVAALLKLTAVVFITGSIDDCVALGLDYLTNGWGSMVGGILLWAFSFGVFYAACISLLETEPLETIILYAIVIFGPVFLMGFLGLSIWSLLA